MDILIVTQDFPPEQGGIQTFMLELARAFLARGHRVRVICPGKPTDPNPLPGLTDLVRIRVHSSWLFLPLLRGLPRYLRQNPSITHVLYGQWQGVLGELLISKSQRKHRSYSLVHGRELLTSVLGPLTPFMLRRAFNRLESAFPVSAEILRMTRIRATPGLPLHLVHPGVDPSHFKPVAAEYLRERYGLSVHFNEQGASSRPPIILCITRMVARKNIRSLIEVLPEVRTQVPGTVLLLGGSGPEKEALKKQVAELGLKEQVKFLGRIEDSEMAAHYCLADVFALPSLSSSKDIEGFGIVFLEAGACEVPVIGSFTGGIPDAVEANVTGLLVPAQDRQKLKEAIIDLLQNRDRALNMGKNARIRIESSLTWTHISDRMLAFMA
jgi:phosphatidyl-myo-inositol dimannoside synthase